jgi:WD40 repeat protein
VNGHPGLLAGRHDRLFVVDLIVAGGETITPELITSVTVEDVSFTCITAADIEGGTVIAIGCHDGTIELRRLDQLEEWSAWSVHQGPVLAVQLVDDVLVTAGADGTAKVLRVSPDLELSGEATFEVTGTWANESRLTTTADQVSELVVGYADGSLDGIRSDAEERLTLQVTAPTQYGTYHETLADGMSTTTTVGSDTMKTFEEVVRSERERRRQAREREAQQQAADLALPGDGPEPTEQNGAAQEAEEDGNFRIVALRAGTTSVDVTSVGSRVLMVSGGYDGRVVLVEDDATFHVLQGAGSDIATVRFVHTGDRWNVVAADRGASGAVRSWALSDDGAPLAEDPTSLGALPSFMATVNLGAGNAVLTWAQGQDVALRAVRTGSARFLGTDLADQPVLELVVGSHAGQDVVAALIEAGEDDRTLRAWSLADGRLLLDQHLTSARDIWGLVLRNSELVALTTAEGASQVVRWNLGEPASGPAPVELRRIGESVWGDEVPYLEGRLRPLPGGPPSLVFSVGETWASVVLVDLEQGTAQEATDSYSDSDSATAITLNGRPAVVESLNGTVEVLVIGDADEEPERVATLEGAHPEDLTVLAGTTDATVVAAGGADGTVRVWQDLRPEPEVFAFRSPIRELEIAADGTILVLCNRGLVALRPRTP